MSRDSHSVGRIGGSALMIALFVIVVMALLASAMGRLLVDSSEKHTVEVRSARALLAAQSGLEIALYRLFPNRTLAHPAPSVVCDENNARRITPLPDGSGLAACSVVVSCKFEALTYQAVVTHGYRIKSEGVCGVADLSGANPDFAVSRILMVDAATEVGP